MKEPGLPGCSLFFLLVPLPLSQVLCGFCLFAILVGFITDAVASFMGKLSAGRTRVVERGHTVVLGWNESTPRLVVQIAFLRRAWRTWPR